jgi:hypothetical protein
VCVNLILGSENRFTAGVYGNHTVYSKIPFPPGEGIRNVSQIKSRGKIMESGTRKKRKNKKGKN